MELIFFCLFGLASFVSQVAGQSLMHVLSTTSQLSTLFRYVNASSSLTDLFNSANNFTLLAPSNSAFSDLLKGQNETSISSAEIDALVRYHVLKGNFPTQAWSAVPQFATTYLDNSTYTNVTTGQVVELVLDDNNNPQIQSWNKTTTSITTKDVACTNGLVQIIPDVLAVPLDMANLVLSSTFNYFYAGLLEAGITNPSAADKGGNIGQPFIDLVANQVNGTDVTFFIPNSAVALEAWTNVTSSTKNSTSALDILKYHIVVNDLVYSTGFQDGMQLVTSTGKNVSIKIVHGIILVNQATITTRDYLVANGVVHVIDGLLDDLFEAVEPLTPQPHSSSSSKVKVAVGVSVGVVVLGLIVAGLLLFRRMKRPTILDPPSRHTPDRKRSYVHNDDLRGNKVNRLLGQDLQLDPPLLSQERFHKANVVELGSTSTRSLKHSTSNNTIHSHSTTHEVAAKRSTTLSNSTTIHEFPGDTHELPTKRSTTLSNSTTIHEAPTPIHEFSTKRSTTLSNGTTIHEAPTPIHEFSTKRSTTLSNGTTIHEAPTPIREFSAKRSTTRSSSSTIHELPTGHEP